MNSSMAEQMFVRHHVESSSLSSFSKYYGELTEWYCSGPLSHHRLFGAKVRILYSPQMSCWQTWRMHSTANRKKKVPCLTALSRQGIFCRTLKNNCLIVDEFDDEEK